MNLKGLITGVILILGEALLMYLVWFLFTFIDCGDDILALNCVVASVIYLLLVWEVVTPMVDLNDPGSRKIAGLGIRWSVWIAYSLAAFIFALIVNFCCTPPLSFTIQLIVQGILVLLLASGILVTVHTGDKAEEVYHMENKALTGRKSMKDSVRELIDATQTTPDVPSEIAKKAETLQTSLRYISPSNNHEAGKYEEDFCLTVTRLTALLYDCKANKTQIDQLFTNAKRILENRKEIVC